jgi:hypothetical protein
LTRRTRPRCCAPPETNSEGSGDPSDGWRWDESKGRATIRLSRSANQVVDPLNPPGDTEDTKVKLRMTGIVDALGPASGNGSVVVLARLTFDDRSGLAELRGSPRTAAVHEPRDRGDQHRADG